MAKNKKVLIGIGCLAAIVLAVVILAAGGAGYDSYRNPSPPANAFPQQVGRFTRMGNITSLRGRDGSSHHATYSRPDGQSVDYSVYVYSSPEAAKAELDHDMSESGVRREPRINQAGQQVGEYAIKEGMNGRNHYSRLNFAHGSWYIIINATVEASPSSASVEFARALPF